MHNSEPLRPLRPIQTDIDSPGASPVLEAYSFLLRALDRPDSKAPRTLLFASARRGEGRTTVLLNLARILHSVGKRVLLVDSDLRHPELHETFQVPNQLGLVNILSGSAAVEAVIQATEQGISLLPAGPSLFNSTSLWKPDSVKLLVARVSELFEVTLFDSPPLLSFADALFLAPYMDATILVLGAGQVTLGQAQRAKLLLQNAGARILGTVLNKYKGV